jgi:predicted secreted protein
MPIASLIAIYFILWWVCLFAVLPIGAKSQVDAGEVHPGSEPGAPSLLRLWPKLLATSVLALVVMLLLMWGMSNPVLREYWT